MNLPVQTNDSATNKKFKPEYVTMTLVAAGIIYGLYSAVPYLLGALHGAVLLAILAAILCVSFGIGKLGSGIRRLITTSFMIGIRFLTNGLVKINPWAIVKNHIKSMKISREEMNGQITILNENISNNEQLIEKNNEEIKDARDFAQAELKKNNKEGASVHANQVGRLSKFNGKIMTLTVKMRYLLGFLEKLHEKVGYSITDMENELKVQEMEYKSLLASTTAFQKAMNIYKGKVDELELKNMAIEEIETKIGNFKGQIDKALRDSSKFMASMETMDEVNIERGLKLLETFDENQYNNILKQLDETPMKISVLNSNSDAITQNQSKYGSFLKNSNVKEISIEEKK